MTTRFFELRNPEIPHLIVTVGIPGSGKSTYAKMLAARTDNVVIHSSDALREELYGAWDDQSHNRELFQELYRRTVNDLMSGKHVILDATSAKQEDRKAIIEAAKSIRCRKDCLYFDVPVSVCLSRNEQRPHQVPRNAIYRCRKNLIPPTHGEGFDIVYTIRRFRIA